MNYGKTLVAFILIFLILTEWNCYFFLSSAERVENFKKRSIVKLHSSFLGKTIIARENDIFFCNEDGEFHHVYKIASIEPMRIIFERISVDRDFSFRVYKSYYELRLKPVREDEMVFYVFDVLAFNVISCKKGEFIFVILGYINKSKMM